ncbi:MAG: hypothetical protein HFE97_11205 [Oscillospiraceae bacterium]|nr:hypothetical protein [Oscillospiraceae bacterium]
MRRRICTGLLVLCLLAGLLSAAQAAGSGFSDVPEDHWAAGDISRASSSAWVEGIGGGLYVPERTLTAVEFLTMMTNTFFQDELETVRPSGSAWYAACWAVVQQQGLLDGTAVQGEDGLYQELNRYDMAQIIFNVISVKGIPVSSGVVHGIQDESSIPSSYQEAVFAVYQLGILTGKEGDRFAGEDTMTRAEATAVLCRMYDTMKQNQKPEPEQTPEPTETPELTPEPTQALESTPTPKPTRTPAPVHIDPPPNRRPTPAPPAPSIEPTPSPVTPSEEPSPSPVTPSEEPTPSPVTPSEEPTPSPVTPSEEPSPSPVTPSEEPSPSPVTPSEEPSPSPVTPSEEPTPSPVTPSEEPSPSPVTPSEEPSPSPVIPSEEPTPTPTTSSSASPIASVSGADPISAVIRSIDVMNIDYVMATIHFLAQH